MNPKAISGHHASACNLFMQTPDVTGAVEPRIDKALADLEADTKNGLTDGEVQERLKKYGPNALVEKQKSGFAALLAYFWGAIPWMIEAAAVMAARQQEIRRRRILGPLSVNCDRD